MAATVSRERREKDLKAMMMGAVLGGRMKRTVSDVLNFLDDLDDAVRFFALRKRGALLDLKPGEKLDRWGVTVRLSERMDRDPEFRSEMRNHPRYMTALSAHEAQGLPMVSFLGQVKEVRLVEEEPGLHWFLLPACHRGCEEIKKPEADHAPGECVVCGRPQGAADGCGMSSDSLATNLDRIHAVDDYLVRLGRPGSLRPQAVAGGSDRGLRTGHAGVARGPARGAPRHPRGAPRRRYRHHALLPLLGRPRAEAAVGGESAQRGARSLKRPAKITGQSLPVR